MEQHKQPQENILNFISHRRRKVATHFSRAELNQLLMLYAEKSLKGEWRHSTMDQRYGLIAYSVYPNPLERPLFTIVKCDRAHRAKGRYALFKKKKRVTQCKTLGEVLMALRTMKSAH